MKCQHCDKPATFHITELTEADGPIALHLCEEHARLYLAQGSEASPATTLANLLAKQLKIEQSSQAIEESEQKACPVCGVTFAQFRNTGRLGCGYDYTFFREELEPLLVNIHGAIVHRGKRPRRAAGKPDQQNTLIQLRREMKEAIEREDYEQAGQLRDQIKSLETDYNDVGEPEGGTAASAGESE